MKQKMMSILRQFDIGMFLSVLFLLGGLVTMVASAAVCVATTNLSALLMMAPGIVLVATAAGLAL